MHHAVKSHMVRWAPPTTPCFGPGERSRGKELFFSFFTPSFFFFLLSCSEKWIIEAGGQWKVGSLGPVVGVVKRKPPLSRNLPLSVFKVLRDQQELHCTVCAHVDVVLDAESHFECEFTQI